jgi:membrane fusion protein, multidrug efflux system
MNLPRYVRGALRASVFAALAAVAACAKKPAPRVVTIPVRVASARIIAAPITVSGNGVVEPLQTVQVEAQVGGILMDVTFHEGDEVQAGQVLFRIDPRPFEAALRQAQAALTRDAAQAVAAQRDAERYRALVAKDYVTKSQADQSVATADALRATVVADSAAVESARLNLAYTTIRSPITGRTGSLLVRRGNLVKASGGPLVVINQIHPILVRFAVTQADFLAIEQRIHSASIAVSVVTADSVPFAEQGVLSFVDNAVDSLTGTVMAKARFENASRKLWPGEYVRATARLGVQPDVVAVPTTAVTPGQNGMYVYVIDAGKTARIRPVKTAQEVGNLTVIQHGLATGEIVVVDGQSRLVPGALVNIIATPNDTTAAGQ